MVEIESNSPITSYWGNPGKWDIEEIGEKCDLEEIVENEILRKLERIRYWWKQGYWVVAEIRENESLRKSGRMNYWGNREEWFIEEIGGEWLVEEIRGEWDIEEIGENEILRKSGRIIYWGSVGKYDIDEMCEESTCLSQIAGMRCTRTRDDWTSSTAWHTHTSFLHSNGCALANKNRLHILLNTKSYQQFILGE